MAQLRLLLISIVAWFALLFNVGHIYIFGQPLSLDPIIYVVIILSCVALLTFPSVGTQKYWAFNIAALAMYLVLRTLFGQPWTDQPVYEHLADVTVLFMSLWLVRRVGGALLRFEQAVQDFILDVDSSRLSKWVEGQEAVNEELYRARRYERPVAIAYCTYSSPVAEDRDGYVITDFIRWRITKTLKHRYCQVKIAQAIAALTYKSDCIIEYGDDVVVCLPETSQEEAETFVRQLYSFIKEMTQLEPKIGIACFPKEGLVLEDLVQTAKKKVRNWSDSEGTGGERTGDVVVDLQERLKIERESVWVNKLAYQSKAARDIYEAIKRSIEIALVVSVLPVMLPVMGLIAVLIKLDDGGSIFYKQTRTGYRGKRFNVYKFRTMIPNAKSVPPQVIVTASGKTRYVWPDKNDKDPRITRVGRFLRKSSLDELPQLLNVLKGDMSLVGPRPTTWDIDKYTLHQTERLTVRPGITGLWQVAARESTNPDERLLWDLKYIHKMSPVLDAMIIWRTFASVFEKKGA